MPYKLPTGSFAARLRGAETAIVACDENLVLAVINVEQKCYKVGRDLRKHSLVFWIISVQVGL